MRVTFLKLANVRTIEAAAFRFRPGVNLIVGVNGVGRTTVLDAHRVRALLVENQVTAPPVPVERIARSLAAQLCFAPLDIC